MDSAFKVFYALILTGIATLGKVLLDYSPVLDQHPVFGSYAHVMIVGGMAFLFYQSRNIASAILAVTPNLRRVLAWRNFIEGDWPLVVVDGKTGALTYAGFLTVGYGSGYLTISGDDWNPDGTHALGFKSMQTYYTEGTLHYWYMQGEGGRQRGYTFIEFFPRGKVANHFTGVFHDKDHPDVRFYGRKLKYKWFARRLSTMDARKAAALAFATEIMPRIPTMLKSTPDTDWE